MKRSIATVGAVALALTTVAKAQEAGTEESGRTQLERLLITDGLTPVEQERSGRAFTVISGEQLEANQVRYVADALRMVPGFAVSRSGSYGGLTQVRVRGSEGNHLLVMVDGVEINEVTQGEFDFGGLAVEDIDRIEVLRGPQSAFWGSNALSGVVNIITRRGSRDAFAATARSEAGTDGTFLGGVALRGGGEAFDVALAGSFRRTDGFNISDFGNEKDGDDRGTMNGNFTVDLTPFLSIDGTFRYASRRSDTDPQDYNWGSPTYGLVLDGNDLTRTREFQGSLGATMTSFDGALTQRARFIGGTTHRENLNGGFLSGDDGRRYNGLYQATYAFDTGGAEHKITGGYEWQLESYLPFGTPTAYKRTTNSFVGEYRGAFADRFFVNAAVRHDMNDRFQDATTFSLSGAYLIPGTDTRLHASVGTGVTNPTFFEQFGSVTTTFVGNPNLVPEESLGWDVGLEQRFFGGTLITDVTYFQADLRNEIGLDSSNFPLLTPFNRRGISKRRGVELSATLNHVSGFSATASYTYTHSTEQSVAGGPRLAEVRRPEHAGSLGVAYVFAEERARVFADVVFNGEMLDISSVPGLPPRVTLDSYTVVNIGGSYKFSENFEAYGRLENIFDEKYEEIFGYNTPGRTAFFGVKGTF